jgi:hypothetical protein
MLLARCSITITELVVSMVGLPTAFAGFGFLRWPGAIQP